MSSTQSTEFRHSGELVQAFERFNEVSLGLTHAYESLQTRIAEFGAEVAADRFAHDQAQSEKQQLADRLTGLLQILPAAVILVDGRGRVDRYNQAAEMLFSNLSWGRLWKEVLQESCSDRVSDGEWLLTDGSRVSVSRRVLEDRGEILLLVDVTDRRRLEAQVLRQERLSAMGEVMAQLAHQIRTPLSTAVLYASQLADAQTRSADRTRFGEKLLDRLRHTEGLIGDMLSFARSGRFVAEPLDLRRVLLDAADTVGPRYATCGASLALDFDRGEALTIQGNRDALIGVVVNLLNNAIDYGGTGVNVRIGLHTDPDRFRIVIVDDGPGVPINIKEKIFDPFFTTSNGGTGLGLAVVQAVALDHGGDVSCLENAEKGAAFELSLPRLVGDVEVWSKEA